tara:strand:- start:1789 stop:3045 length:1257 start_codon:yes stop_codon:yes gene_type:complete
MKKVLIFFFIIIYSCNNSNKIVIEKDELIDKLEGFWLGQSIANWTGLVTEMNKIGFSKDGTQEAFYTRDNWGKMNEKSWGSNQIIDFKFAKKDSIWGSDDDTDIEYMYQELLLDNNTLLLTDNQIRDGWLKHIKKEEENYLWVSNQKAFDLMKNGILPPETSSPDLNPHYEMIDAQLTTEVFGLYSPLNPEYALLMSSLPIRTVARENAEWISQFYIIMHSLSYFENGKVPVKEKIGLIADEARKILPDEYYSAKMYDFVKEKYQSGISWEAARDSLNLRYQINQMDNYMWATKDKSCHGCFAAGINFGASIISLLYGEGDYKKTVQIASLCGWDSDNPAATWGGLLGFIYGAEEIKNLFDIEMSEKYNIHRTRVNFSNDGKDSFKNMAIKSMKIIEKVITEKLNGKINESKFILNKI